MKTALEHKFLAIDAGNSSLKGGVFCGLKKLAGFSQTYDRLDFLPFASEDLKGAIISSVVPSKNGAIFEALQKLGIENPLLVDYRTKTGIKVDYNPPQTLGPDRIALAAGAYHFYTAINKTNSLVVSCGTAITINLVETPGVFSGGAILPGPNLMLEALTKAELLQSPRFDSFAVEIGKSTSASIVAGISSAIIGAINKFREIAGRHTLILTGGYASLLTDFMDEPFIVDTDLSLRGLSAIYIINKGWI